ncbi:dimethylaniline monooxygenase [Favolaschia claudopus]|uniref:Dimethylaniline monooxygenase n=1 Tax=Favolaschia claudopus TaxID=2862362 RepID=A0AAW0B8V2_9AGAR
MSSSTILLTLVLLGISILTQAHFQSVFDAQKPVFHHPIERVAVVGAGPAGLQAAAHLVEHNFTVRLFERAPHPGGNWFYSEETPSRESYPDDSLDYSAQIPLHLPTTKYYQEGDDGLTLEERWTRHWRPRPVWSNLFTNSPKISTELPDVPYTPDTSYVLSHRTIQRHVRSYASHHCLNSNDHCPKTSSSPQVTSYSTLVAKVEKDEASHLWILTLRRLTRLPESNRIQEDWWTEAFDAVVLASGPYVSPHVPDIPGIVDWSKATNNDAYCMYHSQSYRHPEGYAGKTVLIVGASVSASEIARDIGPFTHRLIASVRPPTDTRGSRQRSLSRFPNNTELVPEIASFQNLQTHTNGIRTGEIQLINGSVLQGIDEIILATGYQSSALYPPDSTTRRPQNITWTGHYIPDPTLVYTVGRPWTIGRYQSYGFVKVWKGTADVPPPEPTNDHKFKEGEGDGSTIPYYRDMWYPEALIRKYVTWLNDASLKDRGRFVDPPPIEHLELLKYYAVVHLLNNTQQLDGIGLNLFSPFSKNQHLAIDLNPWDAFVDEDADW